MDVSIYQTKTRDNVEHWKALTKQIECLHYVLLNFAKHFISQVEDKPEGQHTLSSPCNVSVTSSKRFTPG